MLGSLFLCSISILFMGLSIPFGNRIKNPHEKFIEFDKINKEIDDGSRRKD